MKTKLTNIKDIERMSPEKIWEQVEVMFLTSNPMYMRRIQAMETRIIKGETVSDYFNRLKNCFQEADMQKASIGTVMISLLIGNLPAEGNEGKIKNELLKIYSETPNPSEEDLHKFLTKIKEMESIVIASKFRNVTGRGSTIRVVTEQKNEETKQAQLHHVCGKSHKKGSCEQVCKGCGMKGSHKEEKCWKLHPELKPKHISNGREERDRGRQN